MQIKICLRDWALIFFSLFCGGSHAFLNCAVPAIEPLTSWNRCCSGRGAILPEADEELHLRLPPRSGPVVAPASAAEDAACVLLVRKTAFSVVSVIGQQIRLPRLLE